MEAQHRPLSRLSELMEFAAAKLMRPMLRDGETSVALTLNLTHRSLAAPQGELRAVATPMRVSGRVHHFTVNVFDATGLIASAEHARAVVGERKIVGLARRRAGKVSMLLDV